MASFELFLKQIRESPCDGGKQVFKNICMDPNTDIEGTDKSTVEPNNAKSRNNYMDQCLKPNGQNGETKRNNKFRTYL